MSLDSTALDLPLAEAEFVALDLETTGLSPATDRIVEFGAVRFRLAGESLGVFDQLVNPGCRIPRAAAAVHGISDLMVRDQPGVDAVLPRFFEFFGAPTTVLMAHNASFDLGFLRAAAAQLGLGFPRHTIVDTLDLARLFLPELYRRRLIDVVRHLRIADHEDHRGLSDARLAMLAFRAIVARRPELRTLGDLLARVPSVGFAVSRASDVPPVDYARLNLAIEQETAIEIVYLGGSRGESARRITPLSIQQTGGRIVLTAICHIDQIEKTFRMDRILQWRFAVDSQ